MRLTLARLCWLALMVGIVGGCAPQPDMTATDNDNNGHVQIRSGQLFDIVLADDYDQTRCQWRDEHNSAADVVEYLGSRYQPAQKPPAGTGNGTHTTRYRAQQQGTAQIRLVESSNSGKVCRRYALDITVGPPSLLQTITSAIKYIFPYAAGLAVLIATLGLVGRLAYLAVRHGLTRLQAPRASRSEQQHTTSTDEDTHTGR